MIVASFLDMMASSFPFLIFSPNAPFILSALAITFSNVPYSVKSLQLFFLLHLQCPEYYPPHHPSILKYQLPGQLFYTPFFTNFFWPHDFHITSLVARLVNFYFITHQLAIIFIRRNHVNFITDFLCLLANVPITSSAS